jgi:uncharacterized membrane protein YfcA
MRLRTVNVPLALWLAVGSVPAAIAGVWVIELLHDRYGESLDDIVLSLLAVALICVGVLVLVRALFMTNAADGERESFALTRRHKVAAVAIGASTGFVIGLTSAGSGTLIAIFLIAYYRLVPKNVVGTDVFHAAILLTAAGIAHIVSGNVDFGLVGAILLGSIPGVWLGSHLTVKLPTAMLRMVLGVVLVAAALVLLDKSGLGVPLALLLILPAALLAGLIARTLVHRAHALRSAPPPGDALGPEAGT